VLAENKRGYCGVRTLKNGKAVSLVYGRPTALAVDPIEKKPLHYFMPGTRILSLGTAGCNLGCKFCQNWHLSRAPAPEDGPLTTPQDIVRAAHKSGCPAVAFTYNEPTVFAEYAMDIADACHASGLKTVAVTNGYISPGLREEFYSRMDAANVDLKSIRDGFYRTYCDARLQPVLDTLLYIRRSGRTWLELTTLVIPGANDSDEELRELSEWILNNLGAATPLHLIPFRPEHLMTDQSHTPQATLERAKTIARNAGLTRVV